MNWITVQSSNIKAVDYQDSDLFVLFKNNAIYQYFNVPEQVYLDLIDNQLPVSKGKYFQKAIKDGGYQFEKVNIDE